jgi:hypothetical protein
MVLRVSISLTVRLWSNPSRHSLLSSLCDALAWIRLEEHKQQHPDTDMQHSNASVALASPEELALLEELNNLPPVASMYYKPEDPVQAGATATTKRAAVPTIHQDNSHSQLEDQTQLPSVPSSPATHVSSHITNSSSQLASSLARSTSSSSGLGSSKDSMKPSLTASSGKQNMQRQKQQQQQQQLGLDLSCRLEDKAAAAAAAADGIAPPGDPTWLLRHLMSQAQQFERDFGARIRPFGLKELQAAVADR